MKNTIQIQATESAKLLRAQGWPIGGADEYDLGNFPGDTETLAARLGREVTKFERMELEQAIRSELDAASEAS